MKFTVQAPLRRSLIASAAAAGLALAGVSGGTAHAASINVACGGTAQLVNAINTANHAGATIIDLRGCTYTLTVPSGLGGPNAGGQDGLPIITGDIAINNGTIARSAASTTPAFRILEIAKGGKLALNGVTVKGGRVHAKGGGIYVDGRILKNLSGEEKPGMLNLDHSTVTQNTAVDNGTDETLGGGIHSRGTTTVTDSVISENSVIESVAQFPGGEVVAEGGGITNTGTLTVQRSQIINNHAISTGENLGAFGGGLGSFSEPDFRAPAFLTIEDSIISGNTASGRYAEAAAMEVELETTITRTRITGNVSTAQGNAPPPPCSFGLAQCNSGSAFADGALLNQGHLVLTDSVIQNNRSSATGDDHPLVEGAGLANSGTFRINQFRSAPGKADVTRTVISNNTAIAVGPGSEVRGGGIANADQGILTLTLSAVTANRAQALSPHGGGIDNFLNAIVQNPPRSVGTVTLNLTTVTGNSPNNREP